MGSLNKRKNPSRRKKKRKNPSRRKRRNLSRRKKKRKNPSRRMKKSLSKRKKKNPIKKRKRRRMKKSFKTIQISASKANRRKVANGLERKTKERCDSAVKRSSPETAL